MSGLGNVFDAVAPADDVPRGPDLAVTVQVPRSALGRAEGWVAPVPRTLPHEGREVARAIDPHAKDDGIRLHLAAALPDRATLRLRGQGGAHETGAPGDLLVTIELVENERTWTSARALFVIVAIVAALFTLAWVAMGR